MDIIDTETTDYIDRIIVIDTDSRKNYPDSGCSRDIILMSLSLKFTF